MTYPKLFERAEGGHAVLAVGYDLKKKMVLIKNSWGDNWGQDGYFWMPFKVIQNRNMSDDFWTIRM
jgi:C1A family cysteine protease